MKKSQYDQSRTCGTCGHVESRTLSALDAAFEERRAWSTPCVECGDRSFSSGGCAIPEIDEEILEAWAKDTGLTILDQDEDLVIANAVALPMLAALLRRRNIPDSKRQVILSSVCVIVYDNMKDGHGPDSGREAAQSAISFLAENRELFTEIGDICDYIKDVVYPVIGMWH